jgi:hypothetical protein
VPLAFSMCSGLCPLQSGLFLDTLLSPFFPTEIHQNVSIYYLWAPILLLEQNQVFLLLCIFVVMFVGFRSKGSVLVSFPSLCQSTWDNQLILLAQGFRNFSPWSLSPVALGLWWGRTLWWRECDRTMMPISWCMERRERERGREKERRTEVPITP